MSGNEDEAKEGSAESTEEAPKTEAELEIERLSARVAELEGAGEVVQGSLSLAATSWGDRFRALHPKRFFLDTWREMDREAALDRAAFAASGKTYDWEPMIALLLGAICLAVMEYYGGSRTMWKLIEWMAESESWAPTLAGWIDPSTDPEESRRFIQRMSTSPRALIRATRQSHFIQLTGFAWWAGFRFLGYFLVPAIALKLMSRRIRDYGLETKGFWGHAWIYVLCYAVVFVCVIAVSYTEEFSTYYPFYKQANRSWADFICWEMMYALQFFSLEFFFRGYWLKSCKRFMGSHAIYAMVVPYCMIHFGKPFLETIGAIIAGVVLGTLAMKTRSIWSGFLIHVSVAISMDLAALLQTRGWPERFWPLFE